MSGKTDEEASTFEQSDETEVDEEGLGIFPGLRRCSACTQAGNSIQIFLTCPASVVPQLASNCLSSCLAPSDGGIEKSIRKLCAYTKKDSAPEWACHRNYQGAEQQAKRTCQTDRRSRKRGNRNSDQIDMQKRNVAMQQRQEESCSGMLSSQCKKREKEEGCTVPVLQKRNTVEQSLTESKKSGKEGRTIASLYHAKTIE